MKYTEKNHTHLTYCTNIHPGESWQDHFKELKQFLPAVKKRVSPDRPFGVGLRVSARAAEELIQPGELSRFKKWLSDEDLYLFTMNGFPYGNFHGNRVKENVYAPDWASEERLRYTLNLTEILYSLLPESQEGGISTSPISYKYWFEMQADAGDIMRKSVEHLATVAWRMAEIEETHNRFLHLDIEPEPDCLIENSIETVSFFKQWLLPEGGRFLEGKYRIDPGKAKQILRRHIQVCYDTCHFAVEFEEPEVAIGRLLAEGIGIGKVQISSALKVELNAEGGNRKKLAGKLARFDEPTYLHQVVELRGDDTYRQYRDLDQALKHIDDPDAVEWRIHFHVPVFLDRFGELNSTRDHITESLPLLLEKAGCRHYEVETYTWDVLPGDMKADVVESIARELEWVLGLELKSARDT